MQQVSYTLDEMENKTLKNKTETKIISIASGKGGVGKTNIAINMGIAFAELGKKVIVMDADLGLANVNVIIGLVPKYNLYNVLKGQKRLSEIIIETPYGISIIAGASGFSQLANLTKEQKDLFIHKIDDVSNFDILIIDTAAGVSDNVLSFILASDETIIITTPEPTAITDAYGIIKSIASRAYNKNIKLIVNRVGNIIQGNKVADRVINIANQFLNVKVENLGFIYEDEIVRKAVIKQKPFFATEPKSKASQCILQITQIIENIEVPKQKGIKGFFQKFFS